VAAGHAVYFGSSLENASGVLKTFGAEIDVNTARVGGSMVAEIWDGASWVDVGAMDTSAVPIYDNDGPALSVTTGSRQVRLGIVSATTWATKTILAQTLYWFRLRNDTLMTTAPIYEQSKLHPSCSRVNEDGFLEFFGNARRQKQMLVHMVLAETLNGAAPKNQDINWAVGITLDQKLNKMESGNVDGFGEVIQVPPEVDTSLPATLRFGWRPSNNNALNVEFILDYLFAVEGDILNNSLTTTQTIYNVPAPGTTDELVYTDMTIDLSDAVAGESYLIFSLRRDGPAGADTFTGNVEGAFLQLLSYQWQG
jgi:hypothetical protein